MPRINFTRILIADSDVPEWEAAVGDQVQRVSSEPGTFLYGFIRRPQAGSTLLPAAGNGFTEYLHFQCYQNEEAATTRSADWPRSEFSKA